MAITITVICFHYVFSQ